MNDMLAKIAAISSIIFLIGIIIIFQLGTETNLSAQAKEIDNKIKANAAAQENETMEMNLNDNLEIPISNNISKNDVIITKDMLRKSVQISFSVANSTFDISKVVNTAKQIAKIDYSSSKDKMNISISLNNYYDTVWCFKGGYLYMRFFDPLNGQPVIVVDPGHGGYDVGADKGDIYEKNISLAICSKLKAISKNDKFKIYFTRETDTYPTVEERVQFVNNIHPDLFISVHCNWYDNDVINGTGVLYNEKNNSSINSSYWLANIVNDELNKSCGMANKGLMEGNSIYIVRRSEVPVALAEIGFMSNDSDLKILMSDKGQQNAANGIHNSIIRALKELGKI